MNKTKDDKEFDAFMNTIMTRAKLSLEYEAKRKLREQQFLDFLLAKNGIKRKGNNIFISKSQ